MEFIKGNIDHQRVVELLNQHLQEMALHSPPESIHALDLNSLKSKDITFWSYWHENELQGCGALKQLDHLQGEIKSMRTSLSCRRKGVAAKMLEHILIEAVNRGYKFVYLETGSMLAFEPARRLYLKYGFKFCQPFAEYSLDPNSVFMKLELE
jgi:putative acetyltransferase